MFHRGYEFNEVYIILYTYIIFHQKYSRDSFFFFSNSFYEKKSIPFDFRVLKKKKSHIYHLEAYKSIDRNPLTMFFDDVSSKSKRITFTRKQKFTHFYRSNLCKLFRSRKEERREKMIVDRWMFYPITVGKSETVRCGKKRYEIKRSEPRANSLRAQSSSIPLSLSFSTFFHPPSIHHLVEQKILLAATGLQFVKC